MAFLEQFLTFFEVGLHFLKVGLSAADLALSKVLAMSFKIELVLVFVSFSFKLVRFLKFQFLDLFHLQFCRSFTLNLTCNVLEQLPKRGP